MNALMVARRNSPPVSSAFLNCSTKTADRNQAMEISGVVTSFRMEGYVLQFPGAITPWCNSSPIEVLNRSKWVIFDWIN
jgi:hypothetical protein